jgi:hypothetical protein
MSNSTSSFVTRTKQIDASHENGQRPIKLADILLIGALVLANSPNVFERQLTLPGQLMIEISIHPPCAPSMLSTRCYYAGFGTHRHLMVMYDTFGMRRVLVSFDLPLELTIRQRLVELRYFG